MAILTFISIVFGNTFVGGTYEVNMFDLIFVENSEIFDYIDKTGGKIYEINIDYLTGGLSIVIAIITIASLIGIQILGSGFSDTTIRVLTLATAYTGIWSLFTILAYDLIFSIETFGGIIFIALTLIYAIGVIQKIAGGND